MRVALHHALKMSTVISEKRGVVKSKVLIVEGRSGDHSSPLDLHRASYPYGDCEDPFYVIADGLATLRLIWGHVFEDKLERALNFTLTPMEKAAKELQQLLLLGGCKRKGDDANG